MKKKYLMVVCGLIFALSLSGCASSTASTAETSSAVEASTDSTSEDSTEKSSESTVTGTITAITADSVTIETEDGDLTATLTEDTTLSMGNPPGDGQQPPQGEAPEGGPGGDDAGKPEDGGQPPQDNGQAPQGEAPKGGPGGDDAGKPEDMKVTDLLKIGDEITITLDDDWNAVTIEMASNGNGGPGGNGPEGGAPGGGSEVVTSWDAVKTITEDTDLKSESIESTGADENAVLVQNGASASLSDMTVSRTSSDSTGGDNASFYGVGAAALVTDGELTITGSKITTDSQGGAGVFAYGSGIAKVSDTTIETKQNTSGGIHVAGGGTLYADNLTVTTNGESSAAIRSDRGGGTMEVTKGSYTSNGTGSPAVYCTAGITVSDADLTATNSEAVCIEGKNSLILNNCNLTGDMPENDQNDCTWNVIVYQSMSGDAEDGNGSFSMTGGSLTAKNGGMFYTTNTQSTFYLEDVDITYADDNPFFLKCTGNSNARGWGESGKNGADCSFSAVSQEMEGDILWDSISTLKFDMTDGSTLTGAILQDESNAGDGGDGTCEVTIDKTSSWIVTGDSTVTSLSCKGTIKDANGKTVSIVGTDGTVYVKGQSSYTITAENYSN